MIKQFIASIAALLGIAFSVAASAQLAPIPPNIVTTAPRPMILLNMSKDHQLFYRAYDEYSDLDNDGIPEATYKHSFNYYGYFDPFKCYSYDGGKFNPSTTNTTKYCSGTWSGNFLNWATMARIDVLRKVLYGGMRSTDTSSETILERTHLPTDAHAFAKYYKGEDLPQLTPFTATQLAPSATSSSNRRLTYSFTTSNNQPDGTPTLPNRTYFSPAHNNTAISSQGGLTCTQQVEALFEPDQRPHSYQCLTFGTTFSAGFQIEPGDQIRVQPGSGSTTTFVLGVASWVSGTSGSGSFSMIVTPDSFYGLQASGTNWTIQNLSQTSVTMCNATMGVNDNNAANGWSHSNTNAPLLRIARGDYQLWNAHERRQCVWNEENSGWGANGGGNGNNVAITGLGSASGFPVRANVGVTTGGHGPDFVVRVKVCDPARLGTERCQAYPSGNYKPVGLLQEYGERNLAEFALVTGSFAKNTSGGVVRSNMQSFRNEVNYTTSGTFTTQTGIVSTLNRLRVYGYRYSDGTYIGDGNCTYQLTGLNDNQCTSWGNPLGEMYLESLRYLAGKSSSSAFDYTSSGSKDAAMNLPKPAWVDPFLRSSTSERESIEQTFGKAQCRPINVLNFNASVTSYDHDQLAGLSDLTATGATSLMNTIGADELIHGKTWFVGSNGSTNDRVCTAKTVSSLANVRGICPDGPAYYGSYGLAGLSYWAHTNPIRTDISTTGNPDKAFRVKTYGVSLAPGKPRIVISHPTSPTRTVVIQPAYKLDLGGSNVGGGTLVDFRIISQTATSGRYLVIWEDSEQGGDYDQDASGILEWRVDGNTIYVTTRTFAAATANPQGFGYTISGTDKDGLHFHSGIIGFNYTDPTSLTVVQVNADGSTQTTAKINSSGGCSNCVVNDPATRATYQFSSTAAAGVLQEPMWFAAKWGGFNDSTVPTGKPDDVSKWDVKKFDGTLGADGTPDSYFLAYRADLLEQALRSVFDEIISSSNTAPAVASAQITEGSLKYLAKFDGGDGHGELQAFQVQPDGSFASTAKWGAHQQLTSASLAGTRQIITNVSGTSGVALTWANLSDAQKSATFAGLGPEAQARLNWVRGNRSDEAPNGYRFRARNSQSVMGAVVNSNPHVQAPPRADFSGSNFTGYGTFRSTHASRTPIVWVGTQDGMLHGFNATAGSDGGKPILSYLPGPLLNRAGEWSNPANPAVLAMMDGTPFTGDVQVSGTWATHLYASLGRGGRGIFALDVTDPTTLNESNAASIFKWQFTPSDDADLGYILSEAGAASRVSRQSGQIAKMNNGKFAALFGNGYFSPSGKAALYILFSEGPSAGNWSGRYVKLVADTGPNNGLSQPMWVDTNGDGLADAIYAGDLKGNLWKFDVSSTNTASWRVALEGKPLFIAKSTDAGSATLSITAVTEFRFHPFGGQIVLFATGRAILDGDFPDPNNRVNGIYGIWDKPAYASMTATALDSNLPRSISTLATRTFTRLSDGTGYVRGDSIDWSTKKGWAVKFPGTNEASVSNPTIAQRLLAVVSIVPNNASDNCFGLPGAYITFLDPISGLLEVNLNGQVTVDGTVVNIASIPIEDQRITLSRDATQAQCTSGQNNCTRIIGEKTDKTVKSANRSQRIFWREIPTLKTKP